MSQLFSQLSYSLGNEDCRTEHEALKIQPGDRVVCITASGDRPLHLLLADAGEVIAVDANTSHNHLFVLKKIALRELNYDQYAGFLGVIPMDNRLEILETFWEKIPLDCREFWELRLKMIGKGVLYQGRMEKWCGRLSKLLRIFRGEKVKQLFQFHHIDEQTDFLSTWETKGLKRLFNFCFHPWIAKLMFRDPGLYDHLGEGIKPADYIYDRFHEYLRRHLAKDSPLLSLALHGKAGKENLPPYLSRLGAALIRSRLDRISHVDADILSYLKTQPDHSIDVFSLSSIASYLDKSSFDALMKEIMRTAKQGARFCMRQFMSNREIPADFKFSMVCDPHLEKKLQEEDRTFVYRFTVGTIRK